MGDREETLLDIVYQATGPQGKNFLNYGRKLLLKEYLEELESPPPQNEFQLNHMVETWITRLTTIKTAVANFPTNRHALEPRNTSTSRTGSPALSISSVNSTFNQSPTAASPPQEPSTRRSALASQNCRTRDSNTCVITGRKDADGFTIEAAHIIPFSLGKDKQCRELPFWKMLELFFGIQAIDTMFLEISGNINSLVNLVSLDNSVHSMFDNEHLMLRPLTVTGEPLSIYGNYFDDYILVVYYPQAMSMPELIQSDRLIITGPPAIRPVYTGSRIHISYNPNWPNHLAILPRPSYFALREFVAYIGSLSAGRAYNFPE